MAICKDCLHYEACVAFSKFILGARDVEKGCEHFKDRTKITEVVRCCDCDSFFERQRNGEFHCHWCSFHDDQVKPDDFCSYGERRTEK